MSLPAVIKNLPTLLQRDRPRFVRGGALASPIHLARPVKLQDIQSEVRRCVEEGERLRVAGGGTAANALWGTDENLMTLDHFRGIESADVERASVWVRAGTRLGDLSEWLAEHGLALPLDGWPSGATVGGAINVGAHGTGPQQRVLSAYATALGLVTADGVFKRIERDEDPKLFHAAALSLGSLGVISHVELRCQPMHPLRIRWFKSALEDTLSRLPELRRNCAELSFEWFPGLKATRIRTAHQTNSAPTSSPLLAQIRDWGMRNAGHWMMAATTKRLPFAQATAQKLALMAMPELDRIDPGPTPAARPLVRNLRLWEAQIDAEDLPDALTSLERLLSSPELRDYTAIEVGFIGKDDLWLSPAHGRDTAFLRLREFRGVAVPLLAQSFHDVLERYDARPAWGSPYRMAGHQLAHLYPKWQDFLAVRARMDPRGTFLNSHLSNLFEVPVA